MGSGSWSAFAPRRTPPPGARDIRRRPASTRGETRRQQRRGSRKLSDAIGHLAALGSSTVTPSGPSRGLWTGSRPPRAPDGGPGPSRPAGCPPEYSAAAMSANTSSSSDLAREALPAGRLRTRPGVRHRNSALTTTGFCLRRRKVRLPAAPERQRQQAHGRQNHAPPPRQRADAAAPSPTTPAAGGLTAVSGSPRARDAAALS